MVPLLELKKKKNPYNVTVKTCLVQERFSSSNASTKLIISAVCWSREHTPKGMC